MDEKKFKKIIWDHYYKNGRHDLVWRKTKDPYKILVSEIMLQQTQVTRVRAFYPKFIKQFPNFRALARAKPVAVLRAWQGLGYNRRALNLQKLSRIVLKKFKGRLPRDREALESLPGIGKGTSGSLRAFAFNEPEMFIETNIRRVFIHFFFPRKKTVTDVALERYIEGTVPNKDPREWYWALMDYGAMLGSSAGRGKTPINPNRKSAHYKVQSRFRGSDREIRGKLLRILLKTKGVSVAGAAKSLKEPKKRVERVVAGLEKEGFIERNSRHISINER